MRHYVLLTVAMMVFFLALFGVAQALDIEILTRPDPWLERGGWIAALVGLALLTGDVLLPVPSTLVMVANGALFGVVIGTALSLVGSLGAGLVGFGLGRRSGALVARLVPEEEQRRANNLLERWGDLAIVVTRPVPIVAETVAVLAGTSQLTWRRMTLATLGGALPASLLYAVTGATAATFDNAVLIFGLVLLVAGAFWALGRWMGR